MRRRNRLRRRQINRLRRSPCRHPRRPINRHRRLGDKLHPINPHRLQDHRPGRRHRPEDHLQADRRRLLR
jgi:hypothetical protein